MPTEILRHSVHFTVIDTDIATDTDTDIDIAIVLFDTKQISPYHQIPLQVYDLNIKMSTCVFPPASERIIFSYF